MGRGKGGEISLMGFLMWMLKPLPLTLSAGVAIFLSHSMASMTYQPLENPVSIA